MFISFEGIDGSGKSTQIELLKKWLNEQGVKVKITEEPVRDSEIYNSIKEHMNNASSEGWIDAILFTADRALHVERVIKPNLTKGLTVITDRYVHSTIAYQTAMGLEREWVIALNKNMPMPNVTIFLDITVDTAMKRINSRNGETAKYEKMEFLKKVRQEYLLMKGKRFIVINGEKNIKEVQEKIRGVINDFM